MGIAPDIGGRGGAGTIVRGPFDFTYQTPNLNTGVEVWTPEVDEVLIDAWIDVLTGFNGTTPRADLGAFKASNVGLFGDSNLGVPSLSAADDASDATYTIGSQSRSIADSQAGAAKIVPLRFLQANPIFLVVSQSGQKGGLAIGGTAGHAKLYVVTAKAIGF